VSVLGCQERSPTRPYRLTCALLRPRPSLRRRPARSVRRAPGRVLELLQQLRPAAGPRSAAHRRRRLGRTATAVAEGDLHRPSSRSRDLVVRPSRTGTPSRTTACRSAWAGQAGANVAPQLARTISASRRTRWSRSRRREISTARAATACSRPSACRARTPLAGRYVPVAAMSQPLARSITWGRARPGPGSGQRQAPKPGSDHPGSARASCLLLSGSHPRCRPGIWLLGRRFGAVRGWRRCPPNAGFPATRVGRCRDAATPGVARPARRPG
jgi:hypothetical protein